MITIRPRVNRKECSICWNSKGLVKTALLSDQVLTIAHLSIEIYYSNEMTTSCSVLPMDETVILFSVS